MDSRYITSATKPEQLPSPLLPEVAFIGRSNCGKSTLLNALLQRKNLARTSRTPGRTRMVNFFAVNDRLSLVDLPGYGYQEAGAEIVKDWEPLMTAYLSRPTIREFLFLTDCRRELDETDLGLLRWLGEFRPPVVVLTKADKISRNDALQKAKKTKALLEKEGVAVADVLIVSSNKKTGIDQLRERVLAYLIPNEPRV